MGQLLENTLIGGVLILAVAALRRILRGRISPNVVLILWAVCILRLLTPVGLHSPASIYSLLGERPAMWLSAKPTEPVRPPAADTVGQNGGQTGVHSAGGQSAEGQSEVDIIQQTTATPQPDKDPVKHDDISVGKVLSTVYIIVSVSAAAWFIRSWLRTRREICALPRIAGEYARAYLPKRARLRVGDMAGAPLTFGVVRPSVVVTAGLRDGEFHYVLRHEAVHAKRGDNIWHYLSALCLCLHWFNPAVWLMAALIRRDVELSCDRAVVAKASEDIRADYANAIISMSTARSGTTFASGFARRKTEERIVNIMKYKKITIAGVLVAAILAGAVTAMALTPAKAAEDAPTDGAETDPSENIQSTPETPTSQPQDAAEPKENFYPSVTRGWGEEEPYIYTVRFPEPIVVEDPDSGEKLEVLSLSVTGDEFIWGFRMPEVSDKQSVNLRNLMSNEVQKEASLDFTDGSTVKGLYETSMDDERNGVEYWEGEWNSVNNLYAYLDGGEELPETVDMGNVRSVTVQGVTYPLTAGPASRGAKLWYESDVDNLWNTKMVAELADGTMTGFCVNYNDLTVTQYPLPDKAALDGFGFDPDTWLTGHGPMPAGTLYYANVGLADAYTLKFYHCSPMTYCHFNYDLITGELTVTSIDGDAPVAW